MDNLVKQFQTNTFGTLNLIQAIMPRWREQKAGYLVVNSSMMARWQTSPGWGGYAASKAALIGASGLPMPFRRLDGLPL